MDNQKIEPCNDPATCNAQGCVNPFGRCEEAAEAARDPDDSVLVCASDLQHSAIFDNHEEARDCMNAIAKRLKDIAAPPVAAGSVDTMQRYDLTMSWGETVMEDCTSGDWVRYDDAIAWNAQECERAKNASSNCIKINEELIQEQKRAEKAELLLSYVAALAHKWNKDAVNDGFAASEPGMEILELLGWPKE